MMPQFSIITPTHNRADYLRQNITSISKQKQVGFDHEHIIVDNSSTDNTADVVRELMKEDPRIKYVFNPRNLGPADALNLGFAQSTGECVIPLDDDDALPLSSLQFRFDYLQQHPDIQWTYGHSIFVDKENKLWKDFLEYRVTYEAKGTDFENLLGRNFIPNGTVTIRRACIEAVGGWNAEIATQDYDMWLKLAHHSFPLGYIPTYLCYYRVHEHQLSKIHKDDGTWKVERDYFKRLYGKE